MRISDWSSDVCSADLERLGLQPAFDAPPERLGRAADMQAVAIEPDRARRGRRPVDMTFDPAKGQRRSGLDEDRHHRLADLFGEPRLLLARPFQRGALAGAARHRQPEFRSAEQPSELQSLKRTSYAVFRLKKK